MIKQTLSLFFWISVALYCFAAANTEIPKECTVGSADYNETLCSETCTKDIHMNESYCGNFTKTAATVQPPQPQQHQQQQEVTPPEVTSPQEAMKNIGLSTPKIDVNGMSTGTSHGSSLIFMVSSFLFCYLFV